MPDKIAVVKLGKELEIADENGRMLRNYVRSGPETWAPATRYQKAIALGQK